MSGKKEKTTAEQLIAIISDEVELFTDSTDTGWARIGGDCYPVRSTKYKRWLQGEFYKDHGKPPHSQATQDVIDHCEGRAMFGGTTKTVNVRCAAGHNRITLDLKSDIISIAPGSWRITGANVVNFWRPKGMEPLPSPTEGGSINDLRLFLNVDSDADFRLLVSWLLAALNPAISCPILVLQGEQGSAKSTTAKILRSLIDPNGALIRPVPRNEHEIHIQAKNSRVICLDNLSGLKKWLSDALCRVCTGTGVSKRKYYTGNEEEIFRVKRPIILNGIDDIATRGDLLDRSIVINLPTITESDRKDERKMWQQFYKQRPGILGALLDGIAYGLGKDVSLSKLPRMADYAEWVTRCEGNYGWNQGTILADYRQNRGEAVETGLEADPTAGAIRQIVPFEGTATELANKIKQVSNADERYLPAPNKIKDKLKRIGPALREVGISWNYKRTNSGSRYVLESVGKKPSLLTRPAQSGQKELKSVSSVSSGTKNHRVSKDEAAFNEKFEGIDLPF